MLKLICLCALSLLACNVALAADPAAGKAKFDKVCAKCHVRADRAETNTAKVEARIHEVVAGKVKHKKKLELTDAEIANLAAYWTAAD